MEAGASSLQRWSDYVAATTNDLVWKYRPMRRLRAVALLIETSNAYARGLLKGILAYIRAHQSWSLYIPEQERGAKPPGWLRNWKGDGVIARIETEEIGQTISRLKIPCVDVSAARFVEGIPWVETDDEVIAKLAFEHLKERGFKNFAFCGEKVFKWSQLRRECFVATVNAAGYQCSVHESNSRFQKGYSWNREKQAMMEWVRKLPRPAGVVACYDIKAQQLLDVCRELNVAVPEEIAVIGVDNDQLLCDLSDPPLSSVIPDTHQTGYLAAELLDRLMMGKNVPPKGHLIKPLGIETRKSTDVLAIEDPHVATALRLIRERAFEGINVQELMKTIPVSRRILESRFKRLVGRTPHQEILRVRIQRVKQLLRETELKMSTIAERAGFNHVEYMSVVFKRTVGVPPSVFRQKH